MNEYKINYRHGTSGIGHFYVEFEGEIPQGLDPKPKKGKSQKFFGKNPEIKNMPFWVGEIKDEFIYNEKLIKNKKQIFTYTQKVTQEQFVAAYKEAIKQRDDGGGIYHGVLDNCISFNQDIYRATGGTGHFINQFSREELKSSSAMAAKHALNNYLESNSVRTVTGTNEQQVSYKYGVAVDRVIENFDAGINTEKTFTIMPESKVNNDHSGNTETNNKEGNGQTSESEEAYSMYTSDYIKLSVAMGLESLFEAEGRERTASAQNAENTAKNFGRASNNPSFSPTKGPSGPKGPNSTPSHTPSGNHNAGAGFKAGVPTDFPSFKPSDSPPSGGGGNPSGNPSGNDRSPSTNFNDGHKSSAQSSSDPFSFFKNTKFKTHNNFNQPISQPSFQPSSQPIFGPSKPNNFISEPGWLYQSSLGQGDDNFSKYLRAKTELRSLVSSCLNSVTCSDSSSTLIEKAKTLAGFSYTSSYSLSKEDVKSASSSSFSFFRDIQPSKFSQGFWTHPLKEELGVAVSHVSPLVLDLDNDGIELLPYTKGVYFDIDNDGFAEKVGWTKPDDGQLARDLNGNGKIDDITELFGDDLISAFFKLSLLDSNEDKIIDEKDEKFTELLVWQDKNSNGYSEAGELKTLKEAGIKSISLITKPDNRIIEGNVISETARFTYTNGRTGEIADVHYHNDDMDSWFKEKNASRAPDFSI